MQWARTNAAAFHGDPTRITIFGESAGAGSVSNHLVAPRSGGLFQGAIMESGPVAAQWVAQPMEVAQHHFQSLVSTFNCSGPNPAACLRAVNATLLEMHKPSCHGSLLDWAPTVDGVELSDFPRALLSKGLAHDVPVILGTNRDEGTLFVNMAPTANASTYAATVANEFGPGLAPSIMGQYPVSRYSKTKDATAAWWALVDVWSDVSMTCAAHLSAQELATTPGRKSGVFMYAFQHEMEILQTLDWVQSKHAYGCCHASELPLVFNIDALLVSEAERNMSRQVVNFWETFAATGSPGGAWQGWTASEPTVMVWDVIDHEASLAPSTTIKQSDCAFWNSRLTQVPSQFFYGDCIAPQRDL